MRLGLLSTAKINQLVLEGASLSDRVDVVALASRDGARAQAYAQEHGIEGAHAGYDALLADPEVDAVYISLPNSLHHEWTLRAIEAGKHVLCEKPYSRRPEEVEEAWDAATRAGLVVAEGFMYRHHPQTALLAELVADGTVGEVRLVRAAFSFLLTREGDVRLDPALDGGSLLDVGCYCVSGARLIAGEPEAVTGHQVLAPSGVDVRFVGAMRFPGDVLAHFDCGFDLPYRAELTVTGAEGELHLGDAWHCREPGIELRLPDGTTQWFDVERENSYALELEDLADAIDGRSEPLLGRADALGQARALDALLRAAAEGGTVEL
jgi:D-xylose 1-dehydrogenase (NADP+, D-xylono-1,5-lactone-forming)